jgi:hypothetical protein
MMKRTLLLSLSVLALPVAASAQAAPGPAGVPPAGHDGSSFRRTFEAVEPLRAAYRHIGLAEALGASSRYLESARAHYRAALTSYQQHDLRKAIAQAHVAEDLARVALVGHQPTPRNLPAPPSPAPHAPGQGGFAPGGRVGFGGHDVAHRDFERPGQGFRGPRRAHGVDIVELAEIERRDNSAEVHQLVSDALAATSAAQRAALAGDVAGAARQDRIAAALAAAARSLAFADAPHFVRSSAPPRQS